jgi:hypothetical protein
MYVFIDWLSAPFQGHTKERIKTLLTRHRIYPGVTKVADPTPGQKCLGVDLVVHVDNQQIFLQVKPSYRWASVTKKMTYANVAIIAADDNTPEGLLTKKVVEGLDYFRT